MPLWADPTSICFLKQIKDDVLVSAHTCPKLNGLCPPFGIRVDEYGFLMQTRTHLVCDETKVLR